MKIRNGHVTNSSSSSFVVSKKKCSTCFGYGLWPDGTFGMGTLDAHDGMITIPCPECGANANPHKPQEVSLEDFEKDINKKEWEK